MSGFAERVVCRIRDFLWLLLETNSNEHLSTKCATKIHLSEQ